MKLLSNFFKKSINLFKRLKTISDENSLRGYIVSIIAIIILIKLIILPITGFILGGTSYPIVSVVSNSMEHKPSDSYMCGYVNIQNYETNFDNWWSYCGNYYAFFNISKSNFEDFSIKNGFNVGDAMVLFKRSPEKIKLGDIIVYERSYDKKPIIHRVININKINDKYYFTTKGDFNPMSANYEINIDYNQIQGVVILKIPFIGYPKYWISKAIGLV